MTIWAFLLGFCCLSPVFMTISVAREAHAGIGSYVLSVITGALIGASCAALMFQLHNRAIRRVVMRSNSFQTVALLVMLVAELLWVVTTCILALLVFTTLLRHIA